MTMVGESEARSVATQITYLEPGTAVNRRFVASGVEVNTGTYRPYPVTVHDGRPFAERFTLDRNGFTLARHHSLVKDFMDKAEVDAVYPDEAIELIRQLTGASHVFPQGWMVRTSADLPRAREKVVGYTHSGSVQPPAGEAHVDFIPDYAEAMARERFERSFPGAQPYRRFMATSLWRCFSEPPQDWPLALCDAASVGWDEGVSNRLVVVDEIPDRAGQLAPIPGEDKLPAAAIFHFNPNHYWWYFSNMNRDEVLLFKFHDSDPNVARRVPHTAFFDPTFPDARPRCSIEFRSLAYFVD